MTRRNLWIILVLLTSCNLPDRMTSTPPASPEFDSTSQAFSTPTKIPIETLLALPTATFAPTSTPRAVLASPINQPVNCRYGPDIAYAVIGSLNVGAQAEIVGKNIDVSWWYVKNPSDPSTFCWLASGFVDVTGSVDALPVVESPPGQVSHIQLRVDPPSLNVACNSFPQYVTVYAEILANGPATVTWRWETSEGQVIDREALSYFEFGLQSIFIQYKITAARDYWIQVHVLAPNDKIGRVTFKATCVP